LTPELWAFSFVSSVSSVFSGMAKNPRELKCVIETNKISECMMPQKV
jgi:hypothetical protein